MAYIIAEAAQGYEGSVEIAKLLVKAAVASKADAIKFQVVYASDLCEEGYQHFELFKQLEMSDQEWSILRYQAKKNNIHFIVDVFGDKSIELARKIDVDAIKLHSTTFFDEKLASGVFSMDKRTYISVGGVEPEEIDAFVERHNLKSRNNVAILFGYQSEPTPIESNNLLRINVLKERTGLEVGFMDHSDGDGEDNVSLSVFALGLGVRIFEKHITLDRALELEDYISGLSPEKFTVYVDTLQRTLKALGSPSISLTEDEVAYRGRALKRIVANRELRSGEIISENDIRFTRPAKPGGSFLLRDVLGKRLICDRNAGDPIEVEMMS